MVLIFRTQETGEIPDFGAEGEPGLEEGEEGGRGIRTITPAIVKLMLMAESDPRFSKLRRLLGDDSYDIIFNSDYTIAYVSRYRLDVIIVIDVKKAQIVNKYKTGSGPKKMALTKDDLYLYVHNSLDRTLFMFDTQVGMEMTSADVPTSSAGLMLSKDDIELFVADLSSGRVQILDARTLQLKGETQTTDLTPFNALPQPGQGSALLASLPPTPSSS